MGHGFHGYIKQPEGAYIYIYNIYMGAIDIYIYTHIILDHLDTCVVNIYIYIYIHTYRTVLETIYICFFCYPTTHTIGVLPLNLLEL